MSKIRSPRSWWVAALATVVSMSGSSPALAQDTAPDDKRWSIRLTGFFPEADADFTVFSTQTGEPVRVDYEDDLMVDDSISALRLDVAVRLSRNGRHLLELHYLDIDRNGRAVLDEELDFGGASFPVNVTVDSRVETRDVDLHYTYLVVKNERGELGLSIGVHGIEVDATIRTVLTAEGIEIPVADEETLDRAFPLPLIGLRGGLDLSSRWRLGAGVRLLVLEIDDIEGSFVDSWARLEYRASDTVSLGAGYSLIDADVERDPSGEGLAEILQASYRYQGPEVFVRFRF